jgi:hypothetical protein
MKMKMFLATLAAMTWYGALPAHAGLLVIDGDTTGDRTWNRPLLAGPTITETANAVPFAVIPFFVSASATYILGTKANFDTYLHLYDKHGFDPHHQLRGLIAGDDDSGEGTLSEIIFDLTADAQYYAVVSGFANSSFGPFTLAISGSGDIAIVTTVSEPETVFLTFVALACLGFSRRLKVGSVDRLATSARRFAAPRAPGAGWTHCCSSTHKCKS